MGTLVGGLAGTLVLHTDLHHVLHLHKLFVIVLRRRGTHALLLLLHRVLVVVHGLLLLFLVVVGMRLVVVVVVAIVVLLHRLHLLFEHLQTASTPVLHHVGESIVALVESIVKLGWIIQRFQAGRRILLLLHLLLLLRKRLRLQRDGQKLRLIDRGHSADGRSLRCLLFIGNGESEHGARILAEHLSRQMRLIAEEELMVVGAQFRSAGDAGKVPVPLELKQR